MAEPRVALVTGGARRVGRAIVRRLADAGFAVAFTYRGSEAEAESLQAECGAWPIHADLTDPDAGGEHIESVLELFDGQLNVLVNNASTFEPGGLAELSLPSLRRMQALHVEAPLLLAQRFAPMLRATRGHIVNMVDLLAERPWPAYLAYCATKAALANVTLSLARTLAPDVTVNGVAPGVVDWPDDYPPAERETYLRRVPLARAGTPADAAELVHFLVTGGSYITGQIIRVDGGRSIT
jgi:pteridine reductase